MLMFSSCSKKEPRLSQDAMKAQSIVLQSLGWLKNASAVDDAEHNTKQKSLIYHANKFMKIKKGGARDG